RSPFSTGSGSRSKSTAFTSGTLSAKHKLCSLQQTTTTVAHLRRATRNDLPRTPHLWTRMPKAHSITCLCLEWKKVERIFVAWQISPRPRSQQRVARHKSFITCDMEWCRQLSATQRPSKLRHCKSG